ncbi:MAG: cytochrome-c peroxidase [Algicola sp.]|nr:cytochrome-c peroxidase [Algicola sp.]
MKSLSWPLALLLTLLFLTSCASDDDYVQVPSQTLLEDRLIELYGSKAALILPTTNDLSLIPSDFNNPITEEKVALGKLLFHETGLATNPNMEGGMNTYSCASCHHADAGFQSGIIQGIGEGGTGFGLHGEGRIKDALYQDADLDVQPIRSPSVLNVAYQDVMLWNGQFGGVGTNEGTEAGWTVGTPKETNTLGFEGVETQAIAGIDVHRLVIDYDFIFNSEYKVLFDAAFPGTEPEECYTKINAALAIAAYERTLLPNQAPFQRWLNGDEAAMDADQIEGARLFFDEAKCFTCHSGPGLNGMDFHALGMKDLEGENVFNAIDDATKRGRGGFTGNPEDDYKFKTPQLYNLKDVGFFGHGGSFQTVRDVVVYKNNAVKENTNVPEVALSSEFTPLNLTEDQIDLITLFLKAALYDNKQNADAQSSADMGCN